MNCQNLTNSFFCFFYQSNHAKFSEQLKKLHTCEEFGAQLRIYFWHLLMNLKNKYLLKILLKWTNKKQNDFNIYNAPHFLKEMKRNTQIYHYFTPVYHKSWWHDLQVLRYRAWLAEIGNFRSFFALLPTLKLKKINILKKLLEI